MGNVGNQLLIPIDFHSTAIKKIKKKEVDLEQLKWWQNFHFWINYPFKIFLH